jgi:glycosyltransferase involved in cell wall biosynthesis
MRIAFYSDTYKPEINGGSTSVDNFTRELTQRGHEIMIFCPEYPGNTDIPIDKIELRRYASFGWPTNKTSRLVWLGCGGDILRETRKFNPDVLHIQSPATIGLAGLRASERLSIPNIQTYHTYMPAFANLFDPRELLGFEKPGSNGYRREYPRTVEALWRLSRYFYSRTDLLLTPVGGFEDLLREHGILAPLAVQTNGIQLADFIVKETYAPSTGRILHFGRLGFEKRADVVVRAFAHAHDLNSELRLDIMGNGPARESLEKLAAELGVAGAVNFLGFVPREVIGRTLREYDLCATASPMETQGMTVLEALACGVPVVGVDRLAIPALVVDGVTGFTAPEGDYRTMGLRMLDITKNPALAERLGRAGYELAKTHNMDDAVSTLEEHYRSVVRNP